MAESGESVPLLQTPLVSVVIPTRGDSLVNLVRALKSVFRGPLLPVRVVVAIDSASRVSVAEMREQIGDQWPGLVVVKSQQSPNAAGTYATGLREVESEWVDFLDDDDEWLPGRLAALVGLISSAEVDVIFAGSTRYCTVSERLHMIDQRGFFWGSYPAIDQAILEADWFKDGRVFGRSSGGALRVALLREIGGFDETLPFGEWTDLYRRLPAGTRVVTLPGAWKIKDRTVHPMFSGKDTRRKEAVARFIAEGSPCSGAWAAVYLAAERRSLLGDFQSALPCAFFPMSVQENLCARTLLEYAYRRYRASGATKVVIVHDPHPAYAPIYSNPPEGTLWRDAHLNRGEIEGASLGIELLGQTGNLAEVNGVLVDSGWCWLPYFGWEELITDILQSVEAMAYVVRGPRASLPYRGEETPPAGSLYWIPRALLAEVVATDPGSSLREFIQSAVQGVSCRRIQLPDLVSITEWATWAEAVALATREAAIDHDADLRG